MYAPIFLIKNWRYVLIASVFLFMIPLIMIGGIFGQYNNQSDSSIVEGSAKVSDAVLRYEPLVRKYAQMYGVEKYVPILLAKMQQESGGTLPDVMQSSESLGLPPNSITDPEYSIKVGVRYFSKLIKTAHGDIKLALQSYNFGGGFIPYAEEHGGYSKEVAIDFSNMMAAKMGWDSYGDINYVDHVLRYYNQTTGLPVGGVGTKTFENVMKIALQFQGMPYQWGGHNPATSFDCSGLWEWSLKQLGIYFPRTAQEQYAYTQRISKDQLRAGDFIFFTGTASHANISHVGIYVGNGRMYNSNDNGVTYSALDGYWTKHIAGYGRLKEMGNQ
ncbi:hypothetical protein BIV60_15365 [Bacillus sp. MUM 116]|uniref:bifunctional lytic transglycosylase/C40 family peptidase n=1 Tax=Bacillus sp. MUM 116 TaxID=1678002 RepID=UPI0008F5D11B|nr:lysozyme family protein [Bacillus sp. MUM 116]OIK12901.1 hypothetical protein BIV60_15365 [Bacillus sp. MUM 116]